MKKEIENRMKENEGKSKKKLDPCNTPTSPNKNRKRTKKSIKKDDSKNNISTKITDKKKNEQKFKEQKCKILSIRVIRTRPV